MKLKHALSIAGSVFISAAVLYAQNAFVHGTTNWRTIIIGSILVGIVAVAHYYQGLFTPVPGTATLPMLPVGTTPPETPMAKKVAEKRIITTEDLAQFPVKRDKPNEEK